MVRLSKEADNARKKAVRDRQAAEKAAAEAKRAAERDRKYRAALAASKEACQAPPFSP